MSKLYLRSDFRQYYDAFCIQPGQAIPEEGAWLFNRFMSDDVERVTAFLRLNQCGILTPHSGYINLDHVSAAIPVVIYDDPLLHAGEGKRLDKPNKNDVGKFYCKYIQSSPNATSFRFLSIGNHSYFLHYSSDDRWRSNCGKVTMNLLDTRWAMKKIPFDFLSLRNFFDVPMLAVDMVEDWESGAFYAMDVNTAPGIDHTPIQDILRPSEVVDFLIGWYGHRNC